MKIKDAVMVMAVSILTLFFLPTLSAVIWSFFFDSMDARLLIQSPFLSAENAAIVTTHGLFGLSIGAWFFLIFYDQIQRAFRKQRRDAKRAARDIIEEANLKEQEAYDLLETARQENVRAEQRLLEAQKLHEQAEIRLRDAQKQCETATQKGMKAAKSLIDKKVQTITQECDDKLKAKDRQYSESQGFIKQQRDTHNRLYEALQAEKHKRKVLFNLLQDLSGQVNQNIPIESINLQDIRKQMTEAARNAVDTSKEKRQARINERKKRKNSPRVNQSA